MNPDKQKMRQNSVNFGPQFPQNVQNVPQVVLAVLACFRNSVADLALSFPDKKIVAFESEIA